MKKSYLIRGIDSMNETINNEDLNVFGRIILKICFWTGNLLGLIPGLILTFVEMFYWFARGMALTITYFLIGGKREK